MNRVIATALLVLVIAGCSAERQYSSPHVVKQFDNNGHLMQQWVSKGEVSCNGGRCMFYDSEGKPVMVTGTLQVTVK